MTLPNDEKQKEQNIQDSFKITGNPEKEHVESGVVVGHIPNKIIDGGSDIVPRTTLDPTESVKNYMKLFDTTYNAKPVVYAQKVLLDNYKDTIGKYIGENDSDKATEIINKIQEIIDDSKITKSENAIEYLKAAQNSATYAGQTVLVQKGIDRLFNTSNYNDILLTVDDKKAFDEIYHEHPENFKKLLLRFIKVKYDEKFNKLTREQQKKLELAYNNYYNHNEFKMLTYDEAANDAIKQTFRSINTHTRDVIAVERALVSGNIDFAKIISSNNRLAESTLETAITELRAIKEAITKTPLVVENSKNNYNQDAINQINTVIQKAENLQKQIIDGKNEVIQNKITQYNASNSEVSTALVSLNNSIQNKSIAQIHDSIIELKEQATNISSAATPIKSLIALYKEYQGSKINNLDKIETAVNNTVNESNRILDHLKLLDDLYSRQTEFADKNLYRLNEIAEKANQDLLETIRKSSAEPNILDSMGIDSLVKKTEEMQKELNAAISEITKLDISKKEYYTEEIKNLYDKLDGINKNAAKTIIALNDKNTKMVTKYTEKTRVFMNNEQSMFDKLKGYKQEVLASKESTISSGRLTDIISDIQNDRIKTRAMLNEIETTISKNQMRFSMDHAVLKGKEYMIESQNTLNDIRSVLSDITQIERLTKHLKSTFDKTIIGSYSIDLESINRVLADKVKSANLTEADIDNYLRDLLIIEKRSKEALVAIKYGLLDVKHTNKAITEAQNAANTFITMINGESSIDTVGRVNGIRDKLNILSGKLKIKAADSQSANGDYGIGLIAILAIVFGCIVACGLFVLLRNNGATKKSSSKNMPLRRSTSSYSSIIFDN